MSFKGNKVGVLNCLGFCLQYGIHRRGKRACERIDKEPERSECPAQTSDELLLLIVI